MPPKRHRRPRVGIPWCSAKGEKANKRVAYDRYIAAVRDAGAEPVEISLQLPDDKLKRLARSLDGFVLPGSAADINPRRYGASRHARTARADRRRERTDDLLLDDALASHKPVLAICYGAQLLNVHLHGTLVQDIKSQLRSPIAHQHQGAAKDTRHPVRISGDGVLASLAGSPTLRVNTSHHQSIAKPGRGLRVVASAPDGVVEAVESTAGPDWVVGVQWHPERMTASAASGKSDAGEALSEALFRQFVGRARSAAR